MPTYYRFVCRGYPLSEWEGPRANDLLLDREMGFVTEPAGYRGWFKLGDGSTPFHLLPWIIGPGGQADSHVPTYIEEGSSWYLHPDRQALYMKTIKVNGLLAIDGILCEV